MLLSFFKTSDHYRFRLIYLGILLTMQFLQKYENRGMKIISLKFRFEE